MRTCTVERCDAKHVAKGYCQNHYRVFMRNGTPTPAPKERKTFVAKGGHLFEMRRRKTTYLHVRIAEAALGRSLPPGAEVHHVNGDPADNHPDNLVICPSHQYHMLIHQRERALNACGNPNWIACKVCHEHTDPSELTQSGRVFYHRQCNARESRLRRAQQRNMR